MIVEQVMQVLFILVGQAVYAVQPGGLQVEPDRMHFLIPGQGAFILVGQWRQVPDDNSGDCIT